MQFTVSSPGPLKGRLKVPGDIRLTLALMSLGMHMEETLSIIYPSATPEVAGFGKFLERYGAVITRFEDGFNISGKRFSGDVVVDDSVFDSILHSIVAGAVFTSQSVRIVGGAAARSRIVKPLINHLMSLGVSSKSVATDGDDFVITEAEFSPCGTIEVESQWAFEAVIAASLAARSQVVISYSPEVRPLSEKVMAALGFMSEPVKKNRSQQAELERRIAKASGEKPREIRRLLWTEKPAVSFEIPGDVTLAAAVAGCAVVTQRSDVTLEGVLWDRERRGFFEALRRMKAQIEPGSGKSGQIFDTADIQVRWSKIDGVHFLPGQAHTMAHELLVLAAVAASAPDETVVSDIPDVPVAGREAFKLLARGLEKLGVQVGDYTEGIVLRGGTELQGDELDSGGRPDVACALAVARMSASGISTIRGCNSDAYPVGEFLDLIQALSDNKTKNMINR